MTTDEITKGAPGDPGQATHAEDALVELRVRLAAAEGQAQGYKLAVADLAERLHAAEQERDARACDEAWRAKRIDIQKLRAKCEQMRKNLVAVDARADERAAERIAAIYEEAKAQVARAQEAAEARVAEVLASIEPHVQAAEAAADARAQEAERAAQQRTVTAQADAKAAQDEAIAQAARAATAERQLEMIRLASVHRVDALREALALAFAWDRRDAQALAAAQVRGPLDVIARMRDLACRGAAVPQ